MAHGDRRGGRTLGTGAVEAFRRAEAVESDLADAASNIVVGEFLSELQSAIRFRMKLGQSQGDWVEEPERYYTDGHVFAVEEAVASQVKLQITVSLDTSASMWINGIMKHAGPTFIALDRIIRASMLDLPEGSVYYAPFIFHETATQIPQAFMNAYTARTDWGKRKDGKDRDQKDHMVMPNFPSDEQWAEARRYGEIPANAVRVERKVAPFVSRKIDRVTGKETKVTSMREQWVGDYRLSGHETFVAPLFERIKTWEEASGDTSAVRLDIVITDGVFDDPADVARASQVQDQRNGRLRTVLLNFLPVRQWEAVQLPGRCSQVPVAVDNLDTTIRSTLTDAVTDLFG